MNHKQTLLVIGLTGILSACGTTGSNNDPLGGAPASDSGNDVTTAESMDSDTMMAGPTMDGDVMMTDDTPLGGAPASDSGNAVMDTDTLDSDAMMSDDQPMAGAPASDDSSGVRIRRSMVPSLIVADQPGGDTVTIQGMTLDQPGYVVIHMDNNGQPGPVIGRSDLIATGYHSNVEVEIDGTRAGAAVYPMLHYDDGDGVYNFPGPDAPVTVDGNVVVSKVNWQ